MPGDSCAGNFWHDDHAGLETAIRVTFVDVPAPFDALTGREMWAGAPEEITEASGSRDPTAGFPNVWAATLECEPAYVDWSALGTVYLYHENIIPDGRYALEAIDVLCDPSVALNYSPAITLNMSGWGDVSGPGLYQRDQPNPCRYRCRNRP